MLTNKCKAAIKKFLKNLYNIDCYKIVQSSNNGYNYFYFNLFCFYEGESFEMLLTVSRHMRNSNVLRTDVVLRYNQADIEADEFIDDYDFTLAFSSNVANKITNLKAQMDNNKIVESLNDINNGLKFGNQAKYYMLYSVAIPLSGIMYKNKGWFDIKTICSIPYLVGNVCSHFIDKHKKNITNVLFNVFLFNDKFDYINSKIVSNTNEYNLDDFKSLTSNHLDNFKKTAFHELFFTYSSIFHFKIEGLSDDDIRGLSIEELSNYIEVQQMVNI